MAAPEKKGGLGLLLSMGDEPDEGGDPLADKQAALRDMFTAAKSGDWEGAAHAFKEAYDICAGVAGGEDDEEEAEDFGDAIEE